MASVIWNPPKCPMFPGRARSSLTLHLWEASMSGVILETKTTQGTLQNSGLKVKDLFCRVSIYVTVLFSSSTSPVDSQLISGPESVDCYEPITRWCVNKAECVNLRKNQAKLEPGFRVISWNFSKMEIPCSFFIIVHDCYKIKEIP